MLRIKYFEKFKGSYPFLVIVAEKNDLRAARDFFESTDSAYLDDSRITEFVDIGPLSRRSLYLNMQECRDIAERFGGLYLSNGSGHSYFDTEALGDEVEIIISYGEYDDLRAL